MARRLSDHHADLGGGKKGSVFPSEVKVKEFRSAEGAGKAMDYPDTEEKLKAQQEDQIRKAERQKLNPMYRQ